MGKKHPYNKQSMSTSFSAFLHKMGFVAFSSIMGNCLENRCISNMMRLVNFFLCIKQKKAEFCLNKRG